MVLIGATKLVGLLPYRMRVPAGGFVLGRMIAPVIGYRKRVRANLDLIYPDMPEAEKVALSRRVPEQIGRTMTELFSPQDFKKIAAQARVTGDGVEALEGAHQAGRPIILVSGHIGNYDAVRSAFIQRGYDIGGLYRKLHFSRFNDYYVSKISQIGEPLFLRGRSGMARMVRFLREGNTLALLIDQHTSVGAELSFFGKTAFTATSAADMALKYGALLVPVYGIRQPDGLSYEVIVEPPVPHTNAEDMIQALNDSLEAQVRAHPEQWLWTHRRWKAVEA